MVTLVSAAPSTFAGAATAHYRTLLALSRHGFQSICVVENQHFQSVRGDFKEIEWVTVDYAFDAYPCSDRALVSAVTEKIVTICSHLDKDGIPIVLLATFLFPFGQAVIAAAEILRSIDLTIPVILVPAGSDIWQLGSQFPTVTRSVLSHRSVARVVTYSDKFADEILERFGVPSVVIPPPVWKEDSLPSSVAEINRLRESVGKELSILSCSNMRPVKGLELTLHLYESIDSQCNSCCLLWLVGPLTDNLGYLLSEFGYRQDLGLSGDLTWFRRGQQVICCAGLTHDTTPFHRAADLAINTSYHDSFNISLAESMCYGTPAATSSVAGIADLIARNDCGVVFDLIDPDSRRQGLRPEKAVFHDESAVVRDITELLLDAQLRSRTGERAAEVTEKELAPEVVGLKWAKVLQEIV